MILPGTIFSFPCLLVLQCVRDLDKFNLVKLGFRLKPIFASAQAASKIDAHFKNGQKWLKNNHLALLVEIYDTLCSYEKKI